MTTRMKVGFAALVVAVIGLVSLVWTGSDQRAGNDAPIKVDYEKYELRNGVDGILHVDRSGPGSAVAMTFHAGSAREGSGRTGFAHLFEHLFFLDSENRGYGGLDRLMTRVGSSTNGSTN